MTVRLPKPTFLLHPLTIMLDDAKAFVCSLTHSHNFRIAFPGAQVQFFDELPCLTRKWREPELPGNFPASGLCVCRNFPARERQYVSRSGPCPDSHLLARPPYKKCA